MKYELYHDESKVGGYWHGILLVPIAQKQTLLQFLADASNNTNYFNFNPLGIKKLKMRRGQFAIVRTN